MQSLGDNGLIHFFDVEVEAQGPDLARGRQPRVNRQCYLICCVPLNVFKTSFWLKMKSSTSSRAGSVQTSKSYITGVETSDKIQGWLYVALSFPIQFSSASSLCMQTITGLKMRWTGISQPCNIWCFYSRDVAFRCLVAWCQSQWNGGENCNKLMAQSSAAALQRTCDLLSIIEVFWR